MRLIIAGDQMEGRLDEKGCRVLHETFGLKPCTAEGMPAGSRPQMHTMVMPVQVKKKPHDYENPNDLVQ